MASLNSNDLLRVILYGDQRFNKETNCKILTASIKFIKDTYKDVYMYMCICIQICVYFIFLFVSM